MLIQPSFCGTESRVLPMRLFGFPVSEDEELSGSVAMLKAMRGSA